jgi:hypothetical protein
MGNEKRVSFSANRLTEVFFTKGSRWAAGLMRKAALHKVPRVAAAYQQFPI